jgi:hypothetical protein
VEKIVGVIDEESRTTDFLESCQKKFTKIEVEWIGRKKKQPFLFKKTITMDKLMSLKFHWIEPEIPVDLQEILSNGEDFDRGSGEDHLALKFEEEEE